MKITRSSVAEVAAQLSPWAVKVLTHFNNSLEFGADEVLDYHKAVLELIGRNAIRPAYDLLSGKWIIVLQSGGKLLVKYFQVAPKEKDNG